MTKFFTWANAYRLFFWTYIVIFLVDTINGESLARTRADCAIAIGCLAVSLILDHRDNGHR